MPLTFNLRHLEEKNLHLEGQLAVAELDLENIDEVIHPKEPLAFNLDVQNIENAILVTGTLRMALDCECVRCLKPFQHRIDLENWACHLPLSGEEKVPVINDCVDLTPYLREDIVLAFPQHPLCEMDCGGLKPPSIVSKPGGQKKPADVPSPWTELNKLKL